MDDQRTRTAGGETTATAIPSSADGAGAAPDAVLAGARIGRYEILRSVGAGGMGEVYAARDIELGRRVALKFVHPSEGAMRTAQVRLRREAQALARLSHPGVVVIYDIGAHADHLFIAMELLEGGTLRTWLRSRRSWREVIAMFVPAGDALGAAHRAGVVHRDFKPENVLVGNDGQPRVVDFGIARTLDQPDGHGDDAVGSDAPLLVTREGALVGTPAYMAPEQLVGGAVDERTDQFSFCVALYEALCGVRPYGPEDLATPPAVGGERVVRALLRAPAPGYRPPRWLLSIVERGLRVEPDARWSSMDALLAAIATGQRRRRVARIALVAVLLASITGVVLYALVRPGLHPVPLPQRARSEVRAVRLTRSHRGNEWSHYDMSPDGTTLVGQSRGGGVVWLEDLETHQRRTLPLPPGAKALQLAKADGRGVVLVSDERGILWRMDLASLTWAPYGRVSGSMDVAPDGRLVVDMVGDHIHVWGSSHVVRTAPSPPGGPFLPMLGSDGQLALLGDDNAVRLLDAELRPTRSIAAPFDQRILGADWAGSRYLAVATATSPGTTRVYEVGPIDQPRPGWRLVHEIEQERAVGITMTDRGIFLEGNGEDRTAWFADLASLHGMDDLRPLPTGAIMDNHLRGWADEHTLMLDMTAGDRVLPALVPTDGGAVRRASVDANVLLLAADQRRLSGLRKADGVCSIVVAPRATPEARWTPVAVVPCFTVWDLVCTDSGRPPCLRSSAAGDRTEYRRFDPFTGAVGDRVYSAEKRRALDGSLSPSGRLAIPRRDPSDILIVDLTSHQERVLAVPRGYLPQELTWSSDESFLLVSGMRHSDSAYDYVIFRVDLATSQTTVVLHNDSEWMDQPRLSPGGRLALVRWAITPTTWLLEGYRPPP